MIVRIDKVCAVYWIEKDLLNSGFGNRTVFRNRLIYVFVREIRLVELNICPGTKRSFPRLKFRDWLVYSFFGGSTNSCY